MKISTRLFLRNGRKIGLIICGLSFLSVGYGQVSGSKAIPADYPSFNAFLTDLNTQGVGSGGVTLTIPAGYTETAPAGGFVLTATGTSLNPIVINGSASNKPVFTAAASQAAGALNDAIIKLLGSDYVTISNLKLQENTANTITTAASNDMTEWGIALLYASVTDGATNCSILNNEVSLNRVYQNTFGIYSNSTHDASAPTTTASATEGNGHLTIQGNQISNVNFGIVVVGPTAATDHNDVLTIGGTSAALGNTISNYGTTGTYSAFANMATSAVSGVLIRNTKNYNVRHNNLTSSNGGVTAGTLRGIHVQSFNNAPTGTIANNLTDNEISLKSASSSSTIQGLVVENTTANGTSDITISNNDFNNTSHVAAATGAITFISSAVPVANLLIHANTFTNISVTTSGSVIFINHPYSMATGQNQTFSNNAIVGTFTKATSGGTVNFLISNSVSTAGSNSFYLNNTFANATVTGATTMAIISNTDGGTASEKTITGNTVQNITGGTSQVTGFNFTYWNGNSVMSGNLVDNISSSGTLIGMNIGSSANNATSIIIENNTITNLSSAGTTSAVTGLQCSNSSSGVEVRKNLIHSLSSSTSGTLTGLWISGSSGGTSVHANKIYNLTTNNAGGDVYGIAVSSGSKTNVYNNLVSDLKAPISSGNDMVRGISVTSLTSNANIGVYHNSVFLNASSSGTNFGSSGLFHSGSTTATTGNLTIQNNIIINESVAAGTGVTAAFRHSNANLNNYNANSNRNLFYAGTPSATNVIFTDGTNTYQTFPSFQAAMAGREANSFTGESAFTYGTAGSFFVSLTGSSSDFLRPVNGIVTQAESGGSLIDPPLIDKDYSAVTRPAGTGTNPDLGAFEFEATTPAPVIVLTSVSPAATTQCTTTSRLVTVDVTTTSGTITSVNLEYQFNGGSTNTVVMSNTSGTTWEGTIPASNPTNAAVTWSVIASNSLPLTSTFAGDSYSDEPFIGVSAVVSYEQNSTCAGTDVVLTAKLDKAGTASPGSGSSTSSSSSASPFYHGYGGVKTQYIYRASELTAMGFTAGDFTSIGINVTAVGTATLNDFTLDLGLTTQAAVVTNTAIVSGLTQVYSNPAQPLVVGPNDFSFGAPFTWDGTSNIVISFCYSNMNTGGSSTTVSTNPSPGFTGAMAIYADNTSAACLYSAASSNDACFTGTKSNSSSTIRPNFLFAGNMGPAIASVNWSDGTSIIGTTNPLTVQPSVNTTYTAEITSSGCVFTPSPSAAITVNALPSTPTASNSAQCGTQVPTASVTSTTSQTTPIMNWYDAASGGTLLQSTNSTTYDSPLASTTTFYVKEVDGVSGCESAAVSVTVTVAAADQISVSGPATSCVANAIQLVVSNTNPSPNQNYTYTWTSAAGSGAQTPLTGSTVNPVPTVAGTYVYQVSGDDGACSALADITVVVNPFTATVAPIHVTCNAGSDGSFSLASSSCGATPLTYSVNSAAYGAIPTNLIAGTYTVQVKDANGYEATTQTIVITQPSTTMTIPVTTGLTACDGDASMVVSATSSFNPDSLIVYFDLSAQPTEVSGASSFPTVAGTPNIFMSATMAALPVGSQITSASFSMAGLSPQGGSWASDLGFGFTGSVTQAYTAGTGAANSTVNFNYSVPIPAAAIATGGGTVNVHYYDKYNDNTGAECIFPTGSNVAVMKIFFTNTSSPQISWWTASTAGTQISTGSSLDIVGTVVMPSGTPPGQYTVYAQANNGSCSNATRQSAIVNVYSPTTSSLTMSSCDSYVLNGQTYNTSGTYSQVLVNSEGCDSTITLNLTINQSSTGSETAAACDSYTWANGQTYTASGTYTRVIQNQSGCDSTITLTLTITPSSTASVTASTCSDYTSPSGTVYTSTGVYTDIIPNAAGCDSTITINLTVLSPTTSSLTLTSCGDYTSPSGATYSTSGTYTDVIPNAVGCDSTITINLTVINIDNSVVSSGVTLSANHSGATYQWIDCGNGNAPIAGATGQSFTALFNGTYAVIITQGPCTETSSCIEITTLGIAPNTKNFGIEIFPNPVQSTFEIRSEQGEFQMTILDLSGKVVLYENQVKSGEKINIEDFVPGVYLVRMSFDNQIKTLRVIKK